MWEETYTKRVYLLNLMQFVILVKRTVNLKTFWTSKKKGKTRHFDVNRHSFYPMRIIGNGHQGLNRILML